MKQPKHKTSKALSIWGDVAIFLGVACIIASLFMDGPELAFVGVGCLITRPFIRGFSILVRNAETGLFENGDHEFTEDQDAKGSAS